MLSWIPLLGPIFQGISSIVGNFTSLAAVKLQTASATTIAETQTSAQIIATTNDDILLRILRDAAILPVVVWSALIGWDTIIGARDHSGQLFHDWAAYWMWHVGSYPDGVSYLPYVVLVFLFGNIGMNIWRNK